MLELVNPLTLLPLSSHSMGSPDPELQDTITPELPHMGSPDPELQDTITPELPHTGSPDPELQDTTLVLTVFFSKFQADISTLWE